ncbi:hypothetical protein OSB04_012120 [Centaurea solstitialis]|uniref:Integrase catalytic domain-containing protein n=1 Tax=Centaurea solstitialis TaxID=347529 RepID=A0AA38TNV0_9ASTR|nr:hypothetical protein OSB04_012120 [Centaurea solstitialis]
MVTQTIPNDLEPTVPIIIINLSNILKLTSTNYLSWKLQIEATLVGYGLFKFLDGSHPTPPPTVVKNNESISNPAHLTWVRQDRLLFRALIGTLEHTIVPLISRITTSQAMWETLANTFASASRGHIKQLKAQLKTITKGPQSITEFMQAVKVLTDQLAILADPVKTEDITDKVLEGLDSSYQGVIDAVNARDTPISFAELHEKLINRELTIKAQTLLGAYPATVHHTSSRPIYHHNNRQSNTPHNIHHAHPHPKSTQLSSPNYYTGQRPFLRRCQWCHTKGHSLQNTLPFVHPVPHLTYISNPPQANVATASAPTGSTPWLLDSGASHHVAHDLSNLSLHQPYDGTEEVVIGDGTGLPITHTGSTLITTLLRSLRLSNVLCVPNMQRNIISIYKLCLDNNISIEFSSDYFFFKDRLTGAILLTGAPKNGSIVAFSGKTYAIDWHHRLGHLALAILKSLLSSFNPNVINDFSFNCNACQCNKSHKLPFHNNSLVSQSPLELLYTDLWTSPLHSHDGLKYYVIFVDHFTKYIWFYPLKHKSDTKEVFIRFKALIEKYFEKSIKTIYSDNGGEYQALSTYLATVGISHLTTPPHTPEHNGYAERRHRHIFWPLAFTTATYLINRLPTVTLQHKSPYQCLFGSPPNYLKLRSFGCLCYPWLRPYAQHKLDTRSLPCIFVGYSSTQSAYYCLVPTTRKIYVSRHVRFVETSFPYNQLVSNQTPSSYPKPDSCCPISLRILIPSTLDNQVTHDESSLSLQQSPNSSHPITEAVTQTESNPTIDSQSSSQQPPPLPTSSIITCSKNHIYKPNPKYANPTTTQLKQTEPTTVAQALQDPLWCQAMLDEIRALHKLGTWDLVPPESGQNLVKCKWVFRIKYKPDGKIERFKARLVAKGFQQRPGIYYTETFCPVVKPATIRTLFSLAVTNNWHLRQPDINNAFLHGSLNEQVYMAQPPGFTDVAFPNYVCKLRKAIYEKLMPLKQAPRAWYTELAKFLENFGFKRSVSDASLFICHRQSVPIYLVVYVDDIVLTSPDSQALEAFIKHLAQRFALKDLGTLSYFLGVEIIPTPQGLHLNKKNTFLIYYNG